MMRGRFHAVINRIIKFTIVIIAVSLNNQCTDRDLQITVYSSSQEGDRLTQQPALKFTELKSSSLPEITINEDKVFQRMDGFGATFNEAGMICLNSLAPEAKEKVLESLFSHDSGAGYTLMKSPMAACDFASAGPWFSYNETPGDTAMEHFSIARDLAPNGLVPYIKGAMKYGKFEIETCADFVSDWMYFGLGKDQKHIRPEYYGALSKYYSKYIQAYAAQGISVKYLNLFNEADNPHYSNVLYKDMGVIIKNHLAARLKTDGLDTRIQLGETCTRDEGLRKFPPVVADSLVKKQISTFTVHGYDFDDSKFNSLTKLHNLVPDIPIWMTEVCYAGKSLCPKIYPFERKWPVCHFEDGELWGNMIVNDMKNWVSGWIYWNMILDQNGGPWLVAVERGDPDNNYQHSVVMINRETKEVTYTGLYYYLAHFSKFVRPGAYRINTEGGTDKLNFVGFKNPDGTVILNVVNNGASTECQVTYNGKIATAKFKAHSITTLKWSAVPK
jgi:glucosylceramidase